MRISMSRILYVLLLVVLSLNVLSQKTVHVTDFMLGVRSDSDQVSDSKNSHTIAATATEVTCFGLCNGTITVTVTGGPPEWPVRLRLKYPPDIALPDVFYNGLIETDFPFTITGLCGSAFPYSLRTQDSDETWSGMGNTPALVSGKLPIDILSSITDETCPGSCDGSIFLDEVSGGTSPYVLEWSNSETTLSIEDLCSGPYNVSITDANSCTEDFPFTISAPPAVTIDSTVYNPVFCFGESGTITVYASGGTPPLQYDIGLGAGFGPGNSFSGLAASTYNITVMDAVGCTNTTGNITLTENTAISISGVVTDIQCFGNTDGAINTTVTGGGAPYTYSWTGPGVYTSTLADISGLAAGDYYVTVTDVYNCTATNMFTISEPTEISITGTNTKPCFGLSNGSVDITVSGGTPCPNYTYLWSNGATTQDITNIGQGSFTVTVTDCNGCTKTYTEVVTQNPEIMVTLTPTHYSCFNSPCEGAIATTVSGGTPPYTFSWSGPTAFVSTDEDLSGLCIGTYSVTVTDALNCTKTSSVSITRPTDITITLTSQTNLTCNGVCTGAIDITVVGGTQFVAPNPPYQYAWSGPGTYSATTQDISNLCAGTYTVTVTDRNGCAKTRTVTITEPPAVSVSAVLTNVTCNGGSNGAIALTVTNGVAPVTFSWTGPAPFTSTSEDISGLVAGTYCVTVTSSGPCLVDTCFTITEPTPIVPNESHTDVTCNGLCNGTGTVAPTGGIPPYSYAWSSGTTPANATTGGLCAGTFTVTITDAVLCTETASVTVTQPAPIVLSTSKTDMSCNGVCDGTATVSVTSGGTPPFTYLWCDGQTTATATALCDGACGVTVTDANGCTSTGSVTINEPAAMTASITSQTNPLCFGNCNGTATVTASGGTTPYSYSWCLGQTTQSVNNLCDGACGVTVTDDNGCTATSSVTLTQPPLLTAAITGQTNPTCFGQCNGSATVTAAGGTPGYTYLWCNSQAGITASGLCDGACGVTVTDNNSCTATASVTIIQPTQLTVTTSQTNVTCNGLCDGTATAIPSGGTPPYTYAWSGGTTPANVTTGGLCAGTYTVTVRDANLCTATATVTITEPAPIVLSISQTNVLCNGQCNGTATVTVVSGGTAPFTYTWSGGSTPNQPTTGGLCAGPYTVTVRDANNCTKTATVTITQPAVLTAANGGFTDVTCGGLCTGTGTITVAGGTLPYSYAWGNGETTNPAVALCAGSFTPTVTDANGCTATASFTIAEPSAMTLALDSTMSCGSFETQVAGITYLPDGTGVSYTSTIPQSDFAAGQTITNASQIVSICANMEHSYLGDMTITITCPNNQSVTLKQYPGAGNTYLGEPIDMGVHGDQPFPGVGYDYCWSMSPMYGTMVAESNSYFYSYTDVEGNTYTNHSYLPAGSYMPAQSFAGLVGCPLNGDWTITVTDNLAIDNGYIFSWLINFDPSVYPNQFCNGTITTTPGGGTPPYTYFWSNGATTDDVQDLCEGSYCVTVSDALGCTVSYCATIIDVDLAILPFTKTDASCNGICNGSATVNYSINGGIPVVYNWSTGATTQTISNLCAGWYKVTVSEADGCFDVDSVEILNQYAIATNFTQTSGIVCNGLCTGAGYYSNFGGTAPYTFTWSPAVSTDSTLTNMCAGTYNVTITDQPGCVANASVVFTQPASIVADSVVVTDVQPCFGDNTGTITIYAHGGTGTLSYDIGSGSQVSNAFIGLAAGTYTPTIADASGCILALPSVTVTEPAQMQITASSTVDVTPCFGGTNGEIHITATGGQGTLAYSITTGVDQPTGNFTGLTAGNYIVTVTDDLGCSLTSPFTINQPPSNLIDAIVVTNVTTCSSDCTGEAVITASGGTLPYNYNIGAGNQLSDTFTGLCAGTYTVTVTDAQNCTVAGPFDITAPPVLQIDSETDTDISCFGASDGTITIVASGGTGTLEYNDGTTTNATGLFTGLAAGTYTITVTDDNGCTVVSSAIVISEPTAISFDNVLVTNITPCFGGSNGAIQVTVNGGTPAYLYDIGSGNQPSATFNGLTAGTYTITVTDNSGCTSVSAPVDVTEPPLLTASFTHTVMVSCGSGCDGELTITPAGGVVPYSYSWSPNVADTDSAVTLLCADMYFVTVTDALGCTVVNNIAVQDTNAFVLQVVSVDSISCYNVCDGEITVVASGSNPPFDYLWSDNQTGPVATGLCDGHYEVTVTDGLNCQRFESFDLGQPDSIELVTGFTDVLCASDCNGTGWVEATGGTPPYTFLWDDPAPQTNDTATGLCVNTYNVTVTDNNGCTAVPPSITISAPPVLSVSFTEDTPVSCFGVCDGVITAVPTGGTAPYTFQWSPNASDITAAVGSLCAGNYDVTVTDANLCTTTGSYTLTEPTQLMAEVTDSTAIACGGGVNCTGTATVTASGGTPGYTYQWDAQTGNQTTTTATALCQGIFIVTVTDLNNCTATDQVSIVDTSNLNLDTLSVTPPSCSGLCDGAAEVIATGGYPPYIYTWGTTPPQNGAIATGLCEGNYLVTVTDDSLCARTIEVVVIAPQPITAMFNYQDPLCTGNCNGWIASNPSGGTPPYSFVWDDPGLSTSDSITGLCAGMYHVTIQDVNGCLITDSLELIGPAVLSAAIAVNQTILCYNQCNGQLAAIPAGGISPYAYSWTGSLTDSLITGLCSGVYDLTITDANGCTATASNTLVNPDSLELSIINVTQIPCGAGACTGTASALAAGGVGPYSFSWTNFSGTFTSTDQDLTGLCAGVYFVTATDGNLCTQTAWVEIIDTSDLSLDTVSISHISCGGLCDGEIEVIATGGYPPYVYNWSNLQTGPVATGLCQGSYAVTVYDSQLCSREMIVDITDVDVLTATTEITPITCSGRCDGIVTIHALGGTPPVVAYQWSIAGPTDSVASGLCPGWYYYTITDANNCVYNDSVELVDPGEMSIVINVLSPVVCAGDCNGSLQAELGWGQYPAQYEWNNGSTDSLLTNLCAGEFILTVTDATLCSSVDTVTLTQPDTLYIQVTDMVEVDCGGACTGSITVEGTGGVGPYTYQWDAQTGNATTPTVINLCPDLYSVTVSDMNGCTAAMNVELTDTSDVEIIPLDSSMVTCYGLCNGDVTIDVTGGTPAYSYEWSTVPVQTLPTVTDLCAGPVQVTVTDANLCIRVREFIITQPDSLYITLVDSQSVLCFGDNNGMLNIDIAGGTPVYDILWNNSLTTQLITGLVGGFYTVTVTDQNGCVDSLNATLNEPAEIDVILNISNPLCSSGTGDGSVLTVVSGGTAPYTFLWSNDSTTQDISGIDAGMYYLTITDGNGCQHVDSAEVTPGIVVDVVAWKDTVICGYDSVQIYGFGSSVFVWTPTLGMSDSLIYNPWVKPGITTIYYFTAFDSICFDMDSVVIQVFPPFDVEAGPDQSILYDHPTQLSGSGGTGTCTYEWVPAEGLTSPTSLTTEANPEETTVYHLLITDENGCTYSDSLKITVLPEIFVPSGFTPNGDGQNDDWEIDMISLFPECEVEVYNRWGEQLFYSKGYPDSERFDGTYKGKDLPVGTYYFIINLHDETFPDPITGPLTIMR